MSEAKHLESESVQPEPPNGQHEGGDSAWHRIGTNAIWLLIFAIVVEIAALAFIGFLWYGTPDQTVWHEIVVRNWTTKAVTLTALALRICMTIQGATCLSMLAAITLEKLYVPIASVAEVSLMRAGHKTDPLSVLLGYLWPLVRHSAGPRTERRAGSSSYRVFVLVFAIGLLLTTTISQFVSTLLVSDLSQQDIPGRNDKKDLIYDYTFTNSTSGVLINSSTGQPIWFGVLSKDGTTRYGYTYRPISPSSYWNAKAPASWPTFAEYSEPPYVAKSIDDTGPNLRAFLPLPTAQERVTIRNYTGKAVVFDSRVTCQKPKVTNMRYNLTGDYDSGTAATASGVWLGILTGNVSTTTKTPQMSDTYENSPFECLVVTNKNTNIIKGTNGGEPQWTICELNIPAIYFQPYVPIDPSKGTTVQTVSGLRSQFRKPSSQHTGAAYLIFTPLTGYGGKDKINPGVPVDTDDSPYTAASDIVKGSDVGGPSGYAMTLCLTSFDVADRDVEVYGETNRTEPVAKWDSSSDYPDLSNIIKQLDTGYSGKGSSPTHTPEERGILHMKPRNDWTDSQPNQVDIDGPEQFPYLKGGLKTPDPTFLSLIPAQLMPYMLASMTLEGSRIAERYGVTWSAMLSPVDLNSVSASVNLGTTTAYHGVSSEDWMIGMFSDMKRRPAAALQAILTSIAGMAYYERIGQYTKSTNAGLVYYVTVQSPGGPYGTKRTGVPNGFLTVILLLIIHLILGAVVLVRFITLSMLSRIGDGWQAISHIALSDECRPIIDAAGAGRGSGGRRAMADVIAGGEVKGSMVGLEHNPDGTVQFKKVV